MLARLATTLLVGVAVVRSAVLVNFQVAAPPNVPKNTKTCKVTVVNHTFGNSYYQPSVYQYTPPTDCGALGSWAAVTLNLTVTSNGTQYDRLAILTLSNTEVWRTSTSEPTSSGIVWTYTKDVSRYIPLFATSGVFNMELNNVITSSLNGQYATTVIATFYSAETGAPSASKSNLIIPIGTKDSTSGGAEVSVPPAFSENVTLPRNAVAAYAEVYASGNGQEEFWYLNAPNSVLPSLPSGVTYGNGAFREVRLLVDGKLAGIALPYATIFTGGVLPTAWRPITAYGALDLPTYYVDLTPFIPVLVDGLPHNISIDVVSAETAHSINSNWYLSANIQAITDSSSKPTIGKMISYSAPPYATSSVTNSTAANGDVTFTLSAKHSVQITSTITSGSGKTNKVTWSQRVQFSGTQGYLNNSYHQTLQQTATGDARSLHNGVLAVSDHFSYPLDIDYLTLASDGSSWNASFDHSYKRSVLPAPFILSTTTDNHQVADGSFVSASTGNRGIGTNNNTFSYMDTKGGTYYRSVSAALNNITYNAESGNLAPGSSWRLLGAKDKSNQETSAQFRLPGGGFRRN